MKKFAFRAYLLIFTVLTFTFATHVAAMTVVDTYDVFLQTEAPLGDHNANKLPLSVAGFDNSLGILNSVNFWLEGTIGLHGMLELFNPVPLFDPELPFDPESPTPGNDPAHAHSDTTVQIELVALSLTSISPVVIASADCFTPSPDPQFPPDICQMPFDAQEPIGIGDGLLPPLDPVVFDSFFDVFVEIQLDSELWVDDIFGSAQANGFSFADFDGNLNVTYDYDLRVPVSEPSAFLLLGLGIIGLGMSRNRYRRT